MMKPRRRQRLINMSMTNLDCKHKGRLFQIVDYGYDDYGLQLCEDVGFLLGEIFNTIPEIRQWPRDEVEETRND
jgi:hypothetical protein